jgi:hypothetical protein
MSLRFIDSFDHYATGNLYEKWTDTNYCDIRAGDGRRGTQALGLGAINAYVSKVLEAQPTWIVGFALRFSYLPNSSAAPQPVLALRDNGTNQVEVRIRNDGCPIVTRNGVELGTAGAFRMVATVYYYIELMATIHPTTGSATLAIDGTTRIALSNVNTRTTSNNAANEIYLTAGIMALGWIDDCYICDATGPTNNTLLGDCRVDMLIPNADGTYSDWTPSIAAAHFSLVDDTPSTDDVDYVSTLVAGARESHHFTALPSMPNPIIYAVQHGVRMRKDDAGLQQLRTLLKSGLTTQVGSTLITLPNTYAWYSDIWETNPDGLVPWTSATVNALEAGVEHA